MTGHYVTVILDLGLALYNRSGKITHKSYQRTEHSCYEYRKEVNLDALIDNAVNCRDYEQENAVADSSADKTLYGFFSG